jgi:hypothetical protein
MCQRYLTLSAENTVQLHRIAQNLTAKSRNTLALRLLPVTYTLQLPRDREQSG